MLIERCALRGSQLTTSLLSTWEKLYYVTSFIVAGALNMFDLANLFRVLNALLAIFIGSVGVIAVFYALNWLVERFLAQWRQQLLPWVYFGPAGILLAAFLILPTFRTLYISFLDSRSIGFVGLKNYIFAFTNAEMLIAFRNNLLWLLLVTSNRVG